SAEEINKFLSGCGGLSSDGRPMLRLEAYQMVKVLKEINPLNFVVPAHIWTPHFSLFGANSGFDSIEECFGDYTKDIFALETGLSSDPAMNRRLSALDNYALVSNSDAHSPAKIGREANVFDLPELNYREIMNAVKTRDKTKFLYTVEFFPEEGKYHYDGHRKCGVCFAPEETKKNNKICPKCKGQLTVGVMHRVCDLSDRDKDFRDDKAIPFKNLIPLVEIIAEAKGVGVNTKTVGNEYDELIKKFGNEFNILLKSSADELKEQIPAKIARAILRVRNNEAKIHPGYDGEYGKIEIFSDLEEEEKQITFF
ncbi:MAG: endonuclease Q family protein, partial [Candidatus Omnitrophota bacterium]